MSIVPGGPLAGFSSLTTVSFKQNDTYCRPRACIKLDEKVYPVKRFSISKNAHGATNTAEFTLGYAGMPDWTNELFRGIQAGNQDQPVYAEIWAGFPANPGSKPSLSGLSRRFYGILDIYDPEDMNETTFHLRSIGSPLTTDRITSQIQNLSTVQFLKTICAPYKIPVVVDPALTQPFTLARVYASEFLVGLKQLIKWDVGLKCSIFDDTDIWEDDGTLYYVQPWNVVKVMQSQKQTSKNYNPLNLEYGVDIIKFTPSHAPQFSRNIRVSVHTYSAKERVAATTRIQSVVGGVNVAQVIRASTATPDWGNNGGTSTTYSNDGTSSSMSQSSWSASGGSSNGSNTPIAESGKEEYDEYIPNLSPTEVQSLAKAIWRQISQHEYQGTFELAVTPQILPYLNIEMRIQLTGYGMAAFNTEYWPRTLDETFDMATEPGSSEALGWRVTIHGVNHTLPLGDGV
ncbi:MAG TPA: hypothetical protein VIX83_03245 [Candidatus Cybelea sp.]